MKVLCQKLGTQQQFCAAYRPDANGKVERFMATWEQLVLMYTNEQQNDWDGLLADCLSAYLWSPMPHGGNVSPYELVFGQAPRFPVDLLLPTDWVERSAVDVRDRIKQIAQLRHAAHQSMETAQLRRVESKARRAAGHVQPRKLLQEKFPVGSCVLLARRPVKGVSGKLAHKYDGPFWVYCETREGERDVYGMLNGKPYAELAVACEWLRPAPVLKEGDSWTSQRIKPIVGETLAGAQAQQEAADSPTDVHVSSGEAGSARFHVKAIRDSRSRRLRTGKHVLEYLVHWRGYGTQHDTWEVEDALDCDRKVRQFHETRARPPVQLKAKRRGKHGGEEGTSLAVKRPRRSASQVARSAQVAAFVPLPPWRGQERVSSYQWTDDESNTSDQAE